MKSLFSKTENQDIIARIDKLSVDSKPLWGKMNVSQMLAHAQMPIQAAFAKHKIKRGLIGFLFGRMAKNKIMSDAPFQKNLPTLKSFLVKDERKFEEEKSKLIVLIQRFAREGPEGLTKEPHPFFGKLTTNEWDVLEWKHIDHHLKQFGV